MRNSILLFEKSARQISKIYLFEKIGSQIYQKCILFEKTAKQIYHGCISLRRLLDKYIKNVFASQIVKGFQ